MSLFVISTGNTSNQQPKQTRSALVPNPFCTAILVRKGKNNSKNNRIFNRDSAQGTQKPRTTDFMKFPKHLPLSTMV